MSLAVAQAILDCKGHYNFLGDVEIPEEWQDDEQDAGAPDKNEQEETAWPIARLCRSSNNTCAHPLRVVSLRDTMNNCILD